MDIDFETYNLGMKRGGTVVLADHDDGWSGCFDVVSKVSAEGLAPFAIELHHVGSTSIAGIQAKPILDILAVYDDVAAFEAQREKMEALGFIWKGEYGVPGRRYYTKYNDDETVGFVHFHGFEKGHPEIAAHLAFRDYLRALPEKAKAYEALKRELAKEFSTQRANYTEGKADFVRQTVEEALAWKQMDKAS